MKKIHTYPLILLAGISLTACGSTLKAPSLKSGTPDLSKQERIDSAIEKAAINASNAGSSSARLVALEKQYKRNSDDPAYALAYAKGLRHAEHLDRAAIILEPFAKREQSMPGVKTEMATIALALGNYDKAEKYAQAAIIQNPSDHLSYQNLGISLDAKEMHPQAERAFRKGLEHWEGNPTTIMNNLALNLATQGFIEEAIEVLEKAKAISPDRLEIERNLRIVRTLNER